MILSNLDDLPLVITLNNLALGSNIGPSWCACLVGTIQCTGKWNTGELEDFQPLELKDIIFYSKEPLALVWIRGQRGSSGLRGTDEYIGRCYSVISTRTNIWTKGQMITWQEEDDLEWRRISAHVQGQVSWWGSSVPFARLWPTCAILSRKVNLSSLLRTFSHLNSQVRGLHLRRQTGTVSYPHFRIGSVVIQGTPVSCSVDHFIRMCQVVHPRTCPISVQPGGSGSNGLLWQVHPSKDL